MTTTNHLHRELAPISAPAWAEIDNEARERLVPLLAARRLVDWSGPGGWKRAATSLGRTEPLEEPPPGTKDNGLTARQRRVLPLAEVRVAFTVPRAEIEDVGRGAADAQLDDLDRAAGQVAEIENRAVFHGWPAAGFGGIVDAGAAPSPQLGEDAQDYPSIVANAVDRLRQAGIAGPYALAVEPSTYTRIVGTVEHGGHLLLDHLQQILDGSVAWALGLDGAVVLTRRGGDFLLSRSLRRVRAPGRRGVHRRLLRAAHRPQPADTSARESPTRPRPGPRLSGEYLGRRRLRPIPARPWCRKRIGRASRRFYGEPGTDPRAPPTVGLVAIVRR